MRGALVVRGYLIGAHRGLHLRLQLREPAFGVPLLLEPAAKAIKLFPRSNADRGVKYNADHDHQEVWIRDSSRFTGTKRFHYVSDIMHDFDLTPEEKVILSNDLRLLKGARLIWSMRMPQKMTEIALALVHDPTIISRLPQEASRLGHTLSREEQVKLVEFAQKYNTLD